MHCTHSRVVIRDLVGEFGGCDQSELFDRCVHVEQHARDRGQDIFLCRRQRTVVAHCRSETTCDRFALVAVEIDHMCPFVGTLPA